MPDPDLLTMQTAMADFIRNLAPAFADRFLPKLFLECDLSFMPKIISYDPVSYDNEEYRKEMINFICAPNVPSEMFQKLKSVADSTDRMMCELMPDVTHWLGVQHQKTDNPAYLRMIDKLDFADRLMTKEMEPWYRLRESCLSSEAFGAVNLRLQGL